MSMQAVVLPKKGGPFTLATHPKPKPGKGELLVRVVANALNPVDWKIGKLGVFLNDKSYPACIGCDVSGIVEEVGPECKVFKRGDEVMTFLKIGAPGFGSFGEFTLAVENVTIRKPKNLTHVEAAAVPLGLITAAAALYNDLALPLPSDISSPRPNSILIWGGSSSIGSFGVQLAKLSGIKTIVAVCGPKNMDYVRSLGATHVLSHEDGIPAVVAKIKSIVGNDLKHAYDCISPATAAGCVQCLAPGGTVSCAAGPPSPKAPAGITAKGTASMIIFSPKKAAWGHQIWQEFGSLLEGGKLKVSPKVVEMNGLESVIGGLKRLEKGEVSSEKLVAVLDQAKARL